MLTEAFAKLPAPSDELRLTVTIPARDEERWIGRCLRALAAQRTPAGRRIAPGSVDVIVYANACSDATAAVAAAIAAAELPFKAYVVANALPEGCSHVGAARKSVMDCAAHRFAIAGAPRGLVASLDADTIVEPDWAEQMLAASHGVDAVAGYVFVAASELGQLPAPVQRLYALEATFRRLCAELEAALDPLPEDPAPRHAAFVGANFAVTAKTYIAAGGIPPLPRLEDREFMLALRRIDARVRFALCVRAATSGRRTPRVDGGFGTERGELYRRAMRGETFFVEHPAAMLASLRTRAAIRKLWHGTARRHDLVAAGELCGLPERRVRRLVNSTLPFGYVYERVAAHARGNRSYGPVPVEAAIVALRAALSRRKTDDATRAIAASGAG